jgi:heterodisulfide reductase subunit B
VAAYPYYPGCSLDETAKTYAKSIEATAGALGINLQEIEDWNCCGATAYMSYDQLKAFSIGARNLALAERMGDQLVTACNACFSVLHKVNTYGDDDQELADLVNDALGAADIHYGGGVTVRHLLQVYAEDVDEMVLLEKIKADFSALKLAPYYGCMLTRPRNEIDNYDQPMMLDDYLTKLGAYVVDYPVKTKCCGGTLITTKPEAAYRMNQLLLEEAKQKEADAIVCICPLCQFNLDNYQRTIGDRYDAEYEIPVVYFTQIVGLAMGMTAKELGLDKHAVKADRLLDKIMVTTA